MEAKPPKVYRKLRIGWSAAWGIAAVLLCVSWVRCYKNAHVFTCPVSAARTVSIWFERGIVALTSKDYQNQNLPQPFRWHFTYVPEPNLKRPEQWMFYRTNVFFYLRVPHWLLVFATVAVAVLQWVAPPRFSTRTLLIATTLVAVVLGLVVWASQ